MWSDISLWFIFAFPWWLMMLSIFWYICCPSLKKWLFRSFIHFLIGLFGFCCRAVGIYPGYYPFNRYIICKYFLLILYIAFLLCWLFLLLHRSFEVWYIHICLLLRLLTALAQWFPKNHSRIQHYNVSHVFFQVLYSFRSFILS